LINSYVVGGLHLKEKKAEELGGFSAFFIAVPSLQYSKSGGNYYISTCNYIIGAVVAKLKFEVKKK